MASDWLPEGVRRLEDLSLLQELLATAEEPERAPARAEPGALLAVDDAVAELAAGRTLARKGKPAPVEDDDPGAPRPLQEHERRAFREMREALAEGRFQTLSDKQRAWCVARATELSLSWGDPSARNAMVPVGRPVETPAVLLNLPKKPPGRRA